MGLSRTGRVKRPGLFGGVALGERLGQRVDSWASQLHLLARKSAGKYGNLRKKYGNLRKKYGNAAERLLGDSARSAKCRRFSLSVGGSRGPGPGGHGHAAADPREAEDGIYPPLGFRMEPSVRHWRRSEGCWARQLAETISVRG